MKRYSFSFFSSRFDRCAHAGNHAIALLILAISFAMATMSFASEVVDPLPPDDDMAPGLFFGAVFVIGVLLVLVGVGIVIGLLCVACIAIFVTLGILSSSVIFAILRRRFSAGFRALHYQLLAVIALPFGIVSLWLACRLFDFHLQKSSILLVGSGIGSVAGISIAFVIDHSVRYVCRRFITVVASPILQKTNR